MIIKAQFSDLENILALTKACAKKMIDNDIYQWNETYPNIEIFKKDVERGELYVFTSPSFDSGKTGQIMGCIVISSEMDGEYKTVNWQTETSEQFYIHRLAVHPEFQGQGIARKLMDFAEELGREQKKKSIRLDTFSKNLQNQSFYESRGYQRLGSIHFPKQSDFPFYCYELILTTT